jgi:hypothetical protein
MGLDRVLSSSCYAPCEEPQGWQQTVLHPQTLAETTVGGAPAIFRMGLMRDVALMMRFVITDGVAAGGQGDGVELLRIPRPGSSQPNASVHDDTSESTPAA